ncbi:hypothetical protein ANN_07819 [Periplaneta americana]|uniref:Chitin-binding type-2 domain-containing protein n=1 Tax=Periplaneta americana TaxID=6978 RepID=A0ABQ8SZP2_PERAM|nr:hypothetical protein ANN_07819 [Periplaneta americana]
MAGLCEGGNEPPDSLKAMVCFLAVHSGRVSKHDKEWNEKCGDYGFYCVDEQTYRICKIPEDHSLSIDISAKKRGFELQHEQERDVSISTEGEEGKCPSNTMCDITNVFFCSYTPRKRRKMNVHANYLNSDQNVHPTANKDLKDIEEALRAEIHRTVLEARKAAMEDLRADTSSSDLKEYNNEQNSEAVQKDMKHNKNTRDAIASKRHVFDHKDNKNNLFVGSENNNIESDNLEEKNAEKELGKDDAKDNILKRESKRTESKISSLKDKDIPLCGTPLTGSSSFKRGDPEQDVAEEIRSPDDSRRDVMKFGSGVSANKHKKVNHPVRSESGKYHFYKGNLARTKAGNNYEIDNKHAKNDVGLEIDISLIKNNMGTLHSIGTGTGRNSFKDGKHGQYVLMDKDSTDTDKKRRRDATGSYTHIYSDEDKHFQKNAAGSDVNSGQETVMKNGNIDAKNKYLYDKKSKSDVSGMISDKSSQQSAITEAEKHLKNERAVEGESFNSNMKKSNVRRETVLSEINKRDSNTSQQSQGPKVNSTDDKGKNSTNNVTTNGPGNNSTKPANHTDTVSGKQKSIASLKDSKLVNDAEEETIDTSNTQNVKVGTSKDRNSVGADTDSNNVKDNSAIKHTEESEYGSSDVKDIKSPRKAEIDSTDLKNGKTVEADVDTSIIKSKKPAQHTGETEITQIGQDDNLNQMSDKSGTNLKDITSDEEVTKERVDSMLKDNKPAQHDNSELDLKNKSPQNTNTDSNAQKESKATENNADSSNLQDDKSLEHNENSEIGSTDLTDKSSQNDESAHGSNKAAEGPSKAKNKILKVGKYSKRSASPEVDFNDNTLIQNEAFENTDFEDKNDAEQVLPVDSSDLNDDNSIQYASNQDNDFKENELMANPEADNTDAESINSAQDVESDVDRRSLENENPVQFDLAPEANGNKLMGNKDFIDINSKEGEASHEDLTNNLMNNKETVNKDLKRDNTAVKASEPNTGSNDPQYAVGSTDLENNKLMLNSVSNKNSEKSDIAEIFKSNIGNTDQENDKPEEFSLKLDNNNKKLISNSDMDGTVLKSDGSALEILENNLDNSDLNDINSAQQSIGFDSDVNNNKLTSHEKANTNDLKNDNTAKIISEANVGNPGPEYASYVQDIDRRDATEGRYKQKYPVKHESGTRTKKNEHDTNKFKNGLYIGSEDRDISQSDQTDSDDEDISDWAVKREDGTDSFLCPKEGNFPHPEDHSKYFSCIEKSEGQELEANLRSCDNGQEYEQVQKRCVPKFSAAQYASNRGEKNGITAPGHGEKTKRKAVRLPKKRVGSKGKKHKRSKKKPKGH